MHCSEISAPRIAVQNNELHARDSLERQRILVVSGTLSGGGAERFVSTLLQHLDRSRFEPCLCLFRDEVAYPLAADVDVSVIGHRGPSTTWRSVRRLSDVIDAVKPDIILSVMDYLGMFVGEALRTCRTQPVWVARTSNHPDFQFKSVRGMFRKSWLKRVYPRADMFVANSQGLAASFQNAFRCARGRTHTLLNPVDVDRIERLSNAEWPEVIDTTIPNLFYSARLQAQKRPDVLLEAFRIVLRSTPARLWMCGEGPLRGRVESLIEKYDLRDHVRMVGFRENTFPLLKAASVAVATSDYEGLPNNVIEAQALGIPVVSTRSAFGPEEVIRHESTGLLAERGNAEDVADCISKLLTDDTFRSKVSANGRSDIRRRFGLSTTISAWEQLLSQSARTKKAA